MKQLIIGSIAVWGAAVCTAATPAATLLFAQEGTQIVDARGVARAAKRGDLVQSGERLLTAPGGISQIRLPDGSLIGVRPGSELKLATPDGPNPPPLITLIQGAARLIGSELMDAKKISNITFQSGVATLRLQGADLESAVVVRGDKGAPPPPGAPGTAPGSYQRLLIGTGSIGSGTQVMPLEPRQVNFVPPTAIAPVVVATAMPMLTVGAPLSGTSPVDAVTGSKTTQVPPTTLAPIAPLAPTGSVTLTAPLQTAPLATAPTVAPLPTAPITLAVAGPTSPIVVTTNPPPLPPPPPLIQPIVSVVSPILIQPIVTKPPVCTRLISGKCV